ncbi:MAG: DUF4402 domain-containing protein [Candidatus Marinimicrobia bacterium]|nr:DUF4402 domain-containing protein [Candidatus Neomarinimicrobiota bacterium]MBT4131825.1 DUF4402 domain-containing protein [Candidatus Neomarinimicrobiota bacterium]MBT4253748.1 DUF4402 domain-containing protein [Candidatus Neomarinimicrobiota bacterium]MBT4419423.1 DUF4402 domain-containing protein [Candidatus Neomarinimicrobiota bacterium]MBT6002149.1 DUF4402 domain-containing protein [Candidatus Neomarinimicrobiota bacterium]
MKKMTLIVLMVTLIASFSFAQDENLDVTATVAVTALSFTANTDIAIGDVTKSTTATVDPLSGAAHANVSGTTTPGNIAILGEEGATVTVAFDATAVLGNSTENMTFTADVIGHITTQPASATSLTSGVSTVDLSGTAGGGGTGTYNFWIGGDLVVAAAQSPGAYSTATGNGSGTGGNGGGAWSMTLVYQ